MRRPEVTQRPSPVRPPERMGRPGKTVRLPESVRSIRQAPQQRVAATPPPGMERATTRGAAF